MTRGRGNNGNQGDSTTDTPRPDGTPDRNDTGSGTTPALPAPRPDSGSSGAGSPAFSGGNGVSNDPAHFDYAASRLDNSHSRATDAATNRANSVAASRENLGTDDTAARIDEAIGGIEDAFTRATNSFAQILETIPQRLRDNRGRRDNVENANTNLSNATSLPGSGPSGPSGVPTATSTPGAAAPGTVPAPSAPTSLSSAATTPGSSATPGGTIPTAPSGASGPVTFRPPQGASPTEVAQARAYTAGCQRALEAGQLSPTGRVSTKGRLRRQASRSAANERARAQAAGTPYSGQAGHVPDTAWTGRPDPPEWLDLTPATNTSLGGQVGGYPVGYRPTEFRFEPSPGATPERYDTATGTWSPVTSASTPAPTGNAPAPAGSPPAGPPGAVTNNAAPAAPAAQPTPTTTPDPADDDTGSTSNGSGRRR
ncbi:hypothetical protein [Allostreptomyces psammosilenae]|uniref:Uncharacterized protein n=1 Tax=Allostreptomyces psammosilenae TaxID=1892865 RepID=A0A852ZRD6_9ACTN|nr:hypothetical protein [Allostreptomyces psammosilenae]NYI03424.1 hypothetical protein [Allostreptomyces psammosilenae]